MKLILLNSPPRSGKDTAARALADLMPGRTVNLKLSRFLKEATHGLYGLIEATGEVAAHDRFETTKDWPRDEFLRLTPRQAYIGVFENYLKIMHGEDILGRMLAPELARFRSNPIAVCVVTDVGRQEDVNALVPMAGEANTLLVELDREGTSWDTRKRVEFPGVRRVIIENNSTTDELKARLEAVWDWRSQ